MISLENFTYRYPGSQDRALRDIDLRIEAGEFCSIIGPNGAGKSTLAYALSGFIPHFFKGKIEGQAFLEGRDISQSNLGELSGEIGLVFQNPFNQITGTKYTVREEIAFGLENLGIEAAEMEERISKALITVGLEEEAQRSPYALSGGQQQRVAIASMLVMRPKLLILDEPTSQLDPHGSHSVFQALARLTQEVNTTVVLIEHKFEWLAEFSDRTFLLDKGKLVASGPTDEVLASNAMRASGLSNTHYARAVEALAERKIIALPKNTPATLAKAREMLA